MTSRAFVLALILAAAPVAAAQSADTTPPAVVRGTVTTRTAAAGLAAATRAAGATAHVVWVGYAVPATWPDGGDVGDGDWWACRVEPDTGPRSSRPSPGGGTLALEPSREAMVLVRLVDAAPERVRLVPRGCTLDLGDRTLVWLTGVSPADSVAYLSGLAAAESRRTADGALAAMARHADPSALDWLISASRTANTPHLRGQALFWLAQRAGDRAGGAIDEAVRRDPDTGVKRRAVFALSQLPADEGVPRLIALAREHSNPVVRKQAFFWLGQSRDPRALAFLAGIFGR